MYLTGFWQQKKAERLNFNSDYYMMVKANKIARAAIYFENRKAKSRRNIHETFDDSTGFFRGRTE